MKINGMIWIGVILAAGLTIGCESGSSNKSDSDLKIENEMEAVETNTTEISESIESETEKITEEVKENTVKATQEQEEKVKVTVEEFFAEAEEVSLFDGETMGLWKATDFGGQGEVKIKDGAIIMEMGNDMTGITWTGPVLTQNYEISLEAKRVEGDDFFCGLTFPIDKSYCSLVCGGWGGSLTGLSSINYYDAANNETTGVQDFKQGQWYAIRVRVAEGKIQAWIDDEIIVDIETEDKMFDTRIEMEESKPLGIATWRTAGAARNIRWHKLP